MDERLIKTLQIAREALDEIIDPIKYARERSTEPFDPMRFAWMNNSADYLKHVANQALLKIDEIMKEE